MSQKSKLPVVPIVLVLVGLTAIFYKSIFAMFSPATLELKIQPAPVIMPSIYKVYADENALGGKYSLFKMLVTNNSMHNARNVEVEYQVPGFIDEWQTIKKFPEILAGQSVTVNCFPSFPEKIIEKSTSSKQNVNIRLKGANISTEEQSFNLKMLGRNEFLYSSIPMDEIRTNGELFDNMQLLSCLVTPEDPIIKYYTQQIQEKILKGEAASVMNKDEEGVRFMLGIYNSMLLSHMVYSGTAGVPVQANDVSSLVQSIRLPREVITGKTGLCIELSLVHASIMMAAGMDPVIYLIPGHAYPGFKMNGNYYAIESTGIGGEGLGGISSAEDAFKAGMKQLQEFMQKAQMGDDRYMLIDIRECVKNGAVAMELKDDTYLRQKIDEIAKSFTPQASYASNTGNDGGGNSGGGGGGNSGGGGGGSNYKTYSGPIPFSYPSNWKYAGNQSGYQHHVGAVLSPSSYAQVEVYKFRGFNNATNALNDLSNFLGQYGRIQFQFANQAGQYLIYHGASYYPQITYNWTAVMKNGSGGIDALILASATQASQQDVQTLTNIMGTIK